MVRLAWFTFIVVLSLAAISAALADPAVVVRAKSDIVIGMSAPLSGPSKTLGQSMKWGIEAGLAEANRSGGIGGHRLRLLALDDSYHPPTAAANMRRLIHDHKVLVVMGSVGTPTARETIPIARAERVLFFAPMSGAALLRPTPPDRYIINVRASYAEETKSMVELLLSRGIDPNDIAFFTQDDAFGDDGYAGAVAALERQGFKAARHLPHGRYARSSVSVESGLITLIEARRPIKAVIMVGTYVPNARFIRLARHIFPGAVYLNLSFVGGDALQRALGGTADDVIITDISPPPDSDLPIAKSYRHAMKAIGLESQDDFASFEGYIATQVLIEGLRAARRLDREAVIDGLLSLGRFDIGLGVPLHLGSNNHQASHTVWPRLLSSQTRP